MRSAAHVLSKHPKAIAEFTPNVVLSLLFDHTVRNYLTHFNIYISANINYVQQMVFYCKSRKKERRLRLLNLLLSTVSQFSHLPLIQVETSTNLWMSLCFTWFPYLLPLRAVQQHNNLLVTRCSTGWAPTSRVFLCTGDLLQVTNSSLWRFMETWPPIGGEGELCLFVLSVCSILIV